MSDFKSRLLTEMSELAEKINKLDAFIGSDKFNELGDIQKNLLSIQIQSMRTYLICLSSRLNHL